jgi:outer membrane protein OmpA-like peptidoglycan-associated protein/tetratricopeptide (TPR) repeat protein
MKTVLFFVFAIMIPFSLSAQGKEQVNLKEYFLDAEYFFAEESYVDALYDYLEIYNNGYKENANINYRIGICYLNIPGQKEKSIDYLLEALKGVSPKYKESSLKQTSSPVDAYLYLGNAYRVNDQLSKAIDAYNKYKELAGAGGESKFADQQILACNTAMRFMENPVHVRITNVGDSINGNSSNFKAVVSGDGRTMAYMNELPFYNAVYVSHYTDKGWTAPVNITPQIQSDGDQYVSSISYNGADLYLTREDAFNSDIYITKFQNGRWSKSVPLAGEDINTKYWESHASISRDGKTLYFTSNRKGGFGEMDIYKSVLQGNGQWGKPVNLGNVINTALNEDTPFITDNDSVLYFSSQGHENMGGYDIFKSRLGPNGQWMEPENLKYPINTTDDNLFYYPWRNARIIYAALIRPGGFGKEDIYAIQSEGDKPLADVIAELIQPVNKPEVTAMVTTPAAPVVQPAENTKQAEPRTPPAEAAKNQPVVNEQPAPAPAVAPVVPANQPQAPREIDLTPVYFAFDNFKLTPDGEAQLKKIYQLMTDFPDVRVRLIGHADAKGTAEYNLGLSQKRAKTTLQYLVNLGIDPGRLSSTGMGEKNFVAINSNPDGTDNPEGRQLNRRVEYEITGTNDLLIKIRIPPIPENLKFKK